MWYDFKKQFPLVGAYIVTFNRGTFNQTTYNGDKTDRRFVGVWDYFPGYTEKIDKINWEDPGRNITTNFRVHEALWLPSIGEYHIPTEEEKNNIYEMALRMELIRTLIGEKPIICHCWLRPKRVNCSNKKYDGINYNELVGGATKSWHIKGKAIDFHVLKYIDARGCSEIKRRIYPMLAQFDIRMKDNPGSTFIHIDCGTVTHERFFK